MDSARSQAPARGGLSRRARRVLRAAAEALFWDGEHDVPADRLDWLDHELNNYMRATAGTTRLAVWLSTVLLQWSPLLMLGRPRRLVGLPRERRMLCLQRLEHSRIAIFALLLGVAKVMLAMVYFEHPQALATTGFDGQCLTGDHPVSGLLPKPLPERPGASP